MRHVRTLVIYCNFTSELILNILRHDFYANNEYLKLLGWNQKNEIFDKAYVKFHKVNGVNTRV